MLDFIRPIARIRFLTSQDQIGPYISQGRIGRCSWVLDDLQILKMINIGFANVAFLGLVRYGADWVWPGVFFAFTDRQGWGKGISPIDGLKAPACV